MKSEEFVVLVLPAETYAGRGACLMHTRLERTAVAVQIYQRLSLGVDDAKMPGGRLQHLPAQVRSGARGHGGVRVLHR